MAYFHHSLRTLSIEPCTSQELMKNCLFGGLADRRNFLEDEADERLSEIFPNASMWRTSLRE